MSIGPMEIMVILLIVLLLFGAKRIPELARSLGKASFEFKKAQREIHEAGRELMESAEEDARKEDEKKSGNSPADV